MSTLRPPWIYVFLVAIASLAAALAMAWSSALNPATMPPTPVEHVNPGHVAGADCASCHPDEIARWTGSHHQLAAAQLDPAAHSARFDGTAVRAGAVTIVPSSAGSLGFAVTDDSGTKRFEVSHTLAVEPLQQYLVTGDRGRLYVAPIAWDVAQARWIDPSAEGAVGNPTDALHWTGITGTWNHMCAECHTTRYEEGYDAATDTYASRQAAMGVTCAACHGADGKHRLDTQAAELDVCGDCHSRREAVASRPLEPAALLDHAVPDLLDRGIPAHLEPAVFTPLGGIQPEHEAFELGPFLQSKMYEKGVRCTDCHDPHAGTLRAEGNAVCTRCHDAPVYDATRHHGHQPSTGATACITCHMQTATYMKVDVRHDHHFRVPDPATSRALGAPDPCSGCHADDGRLDGMAPRDDPASRFAHLVARNRESDPAAIPLTHRAVSDTSMGSFRRASAAAILGKLDDRSDATSLIVAARDADPLVRAAAVKAMSRWTQPSSPNVPLPKALPETLTQALTRALVDPVAAVRLAAIEGLPRPSPAWVAVYGEAARNRPHLDSPSSWCNLGILDFYQERYPHAEASARTALRIDPTFFPCRQLLITVLVKQGRRTEAQQVLDEMSKTY